MNDMFCSCMCFVTGKVKSVRYMSCYYNKPMTMSLDDFATYSARDKSYMFWYCSNLKFVDVLLMNTTIAADMSCTSHEYLYLLNIGLIVLDARNVADIVMCSQVQFITNGVFISHI